MIAQKGLKKSLFLGILAVGVMHSVWAVKGVPVPLFVVVIYVSFVM